ncbi:MAG: VOC family protein [Xanthomonadales bacterium]|nr:VOC family protein [Xanthomonadales bacterium]
MRINLLTLVVRDYDEAIDFMRAALGFELQEDRPVPEQGKRWVVMGPGGGGAQVLLARASTPEQRARIGDQTGGRVAFFLHTDDFEAARKRLIDHGVRIVRPPRDEPYGRVLVFADLYGNLWDLIQPRGQG